MKFRVSAEDKLIVMQTHFMRIMKELITFSEADGVEADDMLDTFALMIAVVLDNDSHLTTERHFKLAAETVAKLVRQRTKDLRQLSSQTGVSVLELMEAGVTLGSPAGQGPDAN